jgi:hypothetical protein
LSVFVQRIGKINSIAQASAIIEIKHMAATHAAMFDYDMSRIGDSAERDDMICITNRTLLGHLPRPLPLRFPPPVSLLTVAQALRSASFSETPRLS